MKRLQKRFRFIDFIDEVAEFYRLTQPAQNGA